MKRKNAADDRRRRRTFTILWTAVLAIGVMTLIYYEMTAVLYILATVGVTILLVVVAMSDLHAADRNTSSPVKIDDAAALGSGVTSTFGKSQ